MSDRKSNIAIHKLESKKGVAQKLLPFALLRLNDNSFGLDYILS